MKILKAILLILGLSIVTACSHGDIGLLSTANVTELLPATTEDMINVDMTAPTAVIKKLDLYEVEELHPEQFVDDIVDESDVTVRFLSPIDYSCTTTQLVVLILEDESGNRSRYETSLRISKVVSQIVCEIDHGLPEASAFLKIRQEEATAEYYIEPDCSKSGIVPVVISVDGNIYQSEIVFMDTVPPSAQVVTGSVIRGEYLKPERLVTNVVESTEVIYQYETEPDFNKLGEQQVDIRIIDANNNSTSLKTVITVIEDTQPPVLFGIEDRVVSLGDAITYKKDVYATDNSVGDIEITVDSSNVNIRKTGDYQVVYTAKDRTGNVVTGGAIISIVNSADEYEELQKKLEELISKIILDGMTQREQAHAIYEYVNKIDYIGYSNKEDPVKEALNGLKKGVGDCYTYFIISKLLFEHLGIPNMDVERLTFEGESHHYWSLINCGDGWYHFDASQHGIKYPPFESFMVTDSELAAYSEIRGNNGYYYRYDKSLYDVPIAQ